MRARTEALAAVGELLDQVGDRPRPTEELRAASARLREHIARSGWPGELLIECGGMRAADLPADDAEEAHSAPDDSADTRAAEDESAVEAD